MIRSNTIQPDVPTLRFVGPNTFIIVSADISTTIKTNNNNNTIENKKITKLSKDIDNKVRTVELTKNRMSTTTTFSTCSVTTTMSPKNDKKTKKKI